jgi:hypothetical protein
MPSAFAALRLMAVVGSVACAGEGRPAYTGLKQCLLAGALFGVSQSLRP